MQPLPQRQVTAIITVIADSDERARKIVDAMAMTDGSTLDYEIVTIVNLDAPAPEPSPAP